MTEKKKESSMQQEWSPSAPLTIWSCWKLAYQDFFCDRANHCSLWHIAKTSERAKHFFICDLRKVSRKESREKARNLSLQPLVTWQLGPKTLTFGYGNKRNCIEWCWHRRYPMNVGPLIPPSTRWMGADSGDGTLIRGGLHFELGCHICRISSLGLCCRWSWSIHRWWYSWFATYFEYGLPRAHIFSSWGIDNNSTYFSCAVTSTEDFCHSFVIEAIAEDCKRVLCAFSSGQISLRPFSVPWDASTAAGI